MFVTKIEKKNICSLKKMYINVTVLPSQLYNVNVNKN